MNFAAADFLRPFRGVHKKHLAGYVAIHEHGINLKFTSQSTTAGSYYHIGGEVLALAGRPIEPRVAMTIGVDNMRAHGVLLSGGQIRDEIINPLITRIITDDTYTSEEPSFDSAGFYPGRIATINSLLTIDGKYNEQIVLVPGQFKTNGAASTTGTQRLWERLDFVTYHVPYAVTDFAEPNINGISAFGTNRQTYVWVNASDASGIQRVTMLYHKLDGNIWQSLDLTQTKQPDIWSAALPNAYDCIEFLIQVVDQVGNVAHRTDYGNPFKPIQAKQIFLPVILRV